MGLRYDSHVLFNMCLYICQEKVKIWYKVCECEGKDMRFMPFINKHLENTSYGCWLFHLFNSTNISAVLPHSVHAGFFDLF